MLILTYGIDITIKIDNANKCTGNESVCRLAKVSLAPYCTFDGDPHIAFAEAVKRGDVPYFKVVDAVKMDSYDDENAIY